jgi:uncharacterized protein YdaT
VSADPPVGQPRAEESVASEEEESSALDEQPEQEHQVGSAQWQVQKLLEMQATMEEMRAAMQRQEKKMLQQSALLGEQQATIQQQEELAHRQATEILRLKRERTAAAIAAAAAL